MKNFKMLVSGEKLFAIFGWILAVIYDRIEYGYFDWSSYKDYVGVFAVVYVWTVIMTWIYCRAKDFIENKNKEWKILKEES